MPDNDEKLSLLAELIKLARADEQYRDIEYEFLRRLAAMLDIDEAEFRDLFLRNIPFNPPQDEPDRILQLHRMVLLMNIDGESDNDEMQFIRESGLHLGLSPLAVEEVLRIMHDFPKRMIPPEVLLDIFRKYHN